MMMRNISDENLRALQESFDWQTGYYLPDGRVLGVPGKRGEIHKLTDPRILTLHDRVDLSGKSVLELGCCEGGLTVQIASRCKHVVAVDSRARNIAGAILRAYVWNLDHRIAFQIADARDYVADNYAFDVIFHCGLLYHLNDPITHLRSLSQMSKCLLLDTHYVTDDDNVEFSGSGLFGRRYHEGGFNDPFSGMTDLSFWLNRSSLLRLLKQAGYDQIEIISDRVERNGPRMTLIAER
jgi:SAM-dependent methyltransferase